MKTKLVIQDEVNVKFLDLEPMARRELVKKLSFMNPKARHMPAFKLGRWDGKVAFATIGGATYYNLLETAAEVVLKHGYEVEIEDKRLKWDFDFAEIDNQFLADIKWPAGHPKEHQPMILNDHQVRSINDYLTPNEFGNRHSIQSISTSAGKTVLCASLSKIVEPYGRTLVIVPGKDLVTQTLEDYANIGLDTGIYFSDYKMTDNHHIISTWQSLTRMAKEENDNFYKIIDGVVAVIVDECFSGDTPILTPNGRVRIDEIKAGDKVINYNEVLGIFKEDTVLKVHRNLLKSNSEEMLEMQFDNGDILRVTANHKFLTKRGWVRADELDNTDVITSINTHDYGKGVDDAQNGRNED